MKKILPLTIALLVGVVIGALAHRTWDEHTAIARHWRTVHELRDFTFNPDSYPSPPNLKNLEPSLAALVAAGELHYIDIVLPTVAYTNRTAFYHWRVFGERHKDDIVWAYGNPSYVAFPTKGEQPMHLQFWYRNESTPIIQQLISELENLETQD